MLSTILAAVAYLGATAGAFVVANWGTITAMIAVGASVAQIVSWVKEMIG